MKKKLNNHYLHYSNCYEDSRTLYNFKKAGTYLSICSGLDNSLALLADDVEEMFVIDYNPIQIYHAKLKLCAYQYLDYEELLIFLGIKEQKKSLKAKRLLLFSQLKMHLEPNVRTYFENNIKIITKTKLINAGKFEKYLNTFSKRILPFLESKKTILAFMEAPTLIAQRQIYQDKWNNPRFKLAFKIFFSKKVMAKLGRDKSYFKYLEKDLAQNLKKRLETGFYHVLNKDNSYFQYMIFRNFNNCLPDYLLKENYQRIKNNLSKIKFLESDFLNLPNIIANHKFDYLNLSDIFEYVSLEEMPKYEKVIDEISNKGAHIIFWNMMVERKLTKTNFQEIASDEELLTERAFLYQKLWRYRKC